MQILCKILSKLYQYLFIIAENYLSGSQTTWICISNATDLNNLHLYLHNLDDFIIQGWASDSITVSTSVGPEHIYFENDILLHITEFILLFIV